MRSEVRQWLASFADTLGSGPVLEVGSLQVRGGGGVALADLRPLFPGRAYLGVDMRAGPGVDCLMDAHALALPDCSVGTVLCLDTLEHIERPWQAVHEMYRVLRPGGWCVLATVFAFAIHGHPCDYWRPTQQGMAVLLQDFATVWTGGDGGDMPRTVLGRGCKGETAPVTLPRSNDMDATARVNPDHDGRRAVRGKPAATPAPVPDPEPEQQQPEPAAVEADDKDGE